MRHLAFLALLTLLPGCFAAELTVRNEFLEVRYDAAANSFSAGAFMREGSLRARGGSAKIVSVFDRTFGKGQAIEVTYGNGTTDRILLFPKLPFVLFRFTLRNNGSEDSITDKVRPLGFAVELGAAPESLKVLGTGGLASPDKAPGSYMWAAVAEPKSRQGVVAGWITSERGSGVVFPALKDGKMRIDAQIDYGKLRLRPGQVETLETFAAGYFGDARLGLEAWADAVARVHNVALKPQPDGYCTWYHARASSEKLLPVQTEFAARQLKPFGLSFIQIDDGWQDGARNSDPKKNNGPKKNFTQIDPKGPYPSGMQATAEMIKSHGFTPGIWFMPFAGTFDDPWFEDKQEWFAKREDGRPYDVRWGGTSLDMTHPGARSYVSGIARRIAREWGYTYFKMDGLWTGSATEMEYVNDAYKDDQIGNAVLHDPYKTNVEAYRDGLKLVREAAGPNVFFLGCNTPQNMRTYGGSFGLVDAMRIGPDNGPAWKSLTRGPRYGTQNYHLHGRVWWNDPDPLYVRASMPMNHAQLISAWVTVSGQLSVSSDAYADLPPERLDLLKRTLPSHGLRARPVDLFESDVARIWQVSAGAGAARRDVVGLFNWEERETTIDYALERMGLAAGTEYAAFEYWTNTLLAPFRDRLNVKLAGATSAVLAVRPVAQNPQLLSTSRHITQGLVDVTAERWDARRSELSGSGKVVGGDPYELRILTYSQRGTWKPAGVEVSAEDRAAGVKANMKVENGLARVTVESALSREVRWTVRFEGAR